MNNFKYFLLALFAIPLLLSVIGSNFIVPYFGSGTFMVTFYYVLGISFYLWTLGLYGALAFEPEVLSNNFKQKGPNMLNRGVLVAFILVGLAIFLRNGILVKNESLGYQKEYTRLEQSQKSLYDEMWKSYSQQKDVATINKDVFLETVRIQMDARRDGPSVAWKWASENTVINHDVYSRFYADLSLFIAEKRAELRGIEEDKQRMVKMQNLLVEQFPNSVYSTLFGVKPIKYSYGFLSDKTNQTFALGIENLK